MALSHLLLLHQSEWESLITPTHLFSSTCPDKDFTSNGPVMAHRSLSTLQRKKKNWIIVVSGRTICARLYIARWQTGKVSSISQSKRRTAKKEADERKSKCLTRTVRRLESLQQTGLCQLSLCGGSPGAEAAPQQTNIWVQTCSMFFTPTFVSLNYNHGDYSVLLNTPEWTSWSLWFLSY